MGDDSFIKIILSAIITITGIFTAARVQFNYAKKTEENKQFQALKTKAYIDFIRATSSIAISQQAGNADKEFDNTILLLDAKARICIYGSNAVIECMAEFWRKGAIISHETEEVFIKLVKQMRNEAQNSYSPQIVTKDISQLVLGKDI
jgi:hypothetical protein